MKLIDYLGLRLKSEPVLELILHEDLQITYNPDLLHENFPDWCAAACKSKGFEVRFDQDQMLDTIWCYFIETNGFNPIRPDLVGAQICGNIDEARNIAMSVGAGFEFRENVDCFGVMVSWAKILQSDKLIHYEFGDDGLRLVTLMATGR